ncbi:MAG: oxidoreductase domain protein [Vampirovibrio sp.]|jgi:predicted dehydrogenase|nr:oxidoreductase domain protein [Vampirovibrio sp.]
MKVLLVALGRMGCRYRDALQNHFSEDLSITTVDPKLSTDETINHYSHLEEVPHTLQFDLAIDASPNQDRLTRFQQFLERNIPHLVIEKPHAASLAESSRMIALLEACRKPPTVLMPFYERYGTHYLPSTLAQLKAGPLKAIMISSGAIGLGCNGIHYIDLANYLFGAEPTEIYASLLPDSVPSPRGAQFMDHAGTLLVHYPAGKLILDMSPDSSAGSNITLIYEHGKIQLLEQIEMAWHWYRQPEDTWTDPFYRTHREVSIVPPCAVEKDLVNVMIPNALKDLLSGRPVPDIYDGHRALRVIALAMASHLDKRPLCWQTEDNPVNELAFQFT